MLAITTLDGSVLHLDDDSVVMVTGPKPGDPPGRSYVTGPAPGPIATDEETAAVLAALHPQAPLAQLTRPDGSPVWIKGGAVTSVRAPIPADVPPGEPVGAVIIVGGCHQAVREDVATVGGLLDRHGGNV